VRLYEMIRDVDVSGVSGTGPVGEVVEFENGWVAVVFYGYTADVPNVIVYSSLADAEKIHGHAGRTRLEPRNNPAQFVGRYGWKPASEPA
jgi:hypothetical protein